MKLLLMGPPGAGKGSQSKKLVEAYDLQSISTGEMFREAYKKGDPMGEKAMEYIRQGELVDDELTNRVVRERLSHERPDARFLLDGYPRTVNQARALDKILTEKGTRLTAVINIVVDKEVIIERMAGRRVCRQCAATYHTKFRPPRVENVCDACGGDLHQREDDKPASVRNRLNIYESKTRPIIDYYKGRGFLINIDGEQSFEKVFRDIQRALRDLT